MNKILLMLLGIIVVMSCGAAMAASCDPNAIDPATGARFVCLGQPCDTLGRTALDGPDGKSKSVISCVFKNYYQGDEAVVKVWKVGGLIAAPLPKCNQPYEVLQSDGDVLVCACNDTSAITTTDCPSPWTKGSGIVTVFATYSCANKTWSSPTILSNTCKCLVAPNKNHNPCPSGYQGTGIDLQQDFNCATNSYGGWYTTYNGCTVSQPTCKWKDNGTCGDCKNECNNPNVLSCDPHASIPCDLAHKDKEWISGRHDADKHVCRCS